MFVVYVLIAIILLIVIQKYEHTLWSPATIIVITWAIFPAINSLQPIGLYPLCLKTHMCILLSLFSFIVAYYSNFTNKRRNISNGFLYIANDTVDYKLLIALNAIIAMWMYTRLNLAIDNLILMGWENQRANSAEIFGGSLENTIYELIAQPVVVASMVLFTVQLFRNKPINKLFIILLFINIIQGVVIFAARANLVKLILYVLLAFFFLRDTRFTKSQLLKLSLFVIIIFVAIAFVSAGRNKSSDASLFETFIVYYIAPFSVFNYYIENPHFALLNFRSCTLGACMLGCIYNFLPCITYILFNIPYWGTDYAITQITSQNVPVSPEISMNAACTANYCFMKDFGVLGIVIGFAAMARIILSVKNKYKTNPTARNAALYIFFLYEITRLSIFYDFLLPSYLVSIVVILVVTRKRGIITC